MLRRIVTLDTTDTPAQVAARLSAVTRPPIEGALARLTFLFTWDGREPPYWEGRVTADAFELIRRPNRVTTGSTTVRLRGLIRATPTGAAIRVTLQQGWTSPWWLAVSLVWPLLAIGIVVWPIEPDAPMVGLLFALFLVLVLTVSHLVRLHFSMRKAERVLRGALGLTSPGKARRAQAADAA